MLANVLEGANGALFGTYLLVLFIFARYTGLVFLDEWEKGTPRWVVVAYKQRTGAISLLTVIASECILRGTIWRWRMLNLPYDDLSTIIGVCTGVTVGLIGGVCALRHFAPRRWGIFPWLVAPALVTMIALVNAFYEEIGVTLSKLPLLWSGVQ